MCLSHKNRFVFGVIALILSSAAAGPLSASETVGDLRRQNLLELKEHDGKTTLDAMHRKGDLDRLLQGLDFFSGCDDARNATPMEADAFLMLNATRLGGMMADLEKKYEKPAGDLIARVKLYQRINEARPYLLAARGSAEENKRNAERARELLMSLTVDEFLEALPIEIRHYDRVATVACKILKTTFGDPKKPRINVRGFALKKLKDDWQQGFLLSSEADGSNPRSSALHVYPDNTLFEAPEQYVDSTIAALLSHELLHGIQHQLNGVGKASQCEDDNSKITNRKRSETTRLNLGWEAKLAYQKTRAKDNAPRAAVGAVVGGVVGYAGGRWIGLPRKASALGGAIIGGGIAAYQTPSLFDIPSLEYEADVEGVVMACQAGYHVEGFRHLLMNADRVGDNAVTPLSDDEKEVVTSVSTAEQAKEYEKHNCKYHPDTRLRWVNLLHTAKQKCPASSLQPITLNPVNVQPASTRQVSSVPSDALKSAPSGARVNAAIPTAAAKSGQKQVSLTTGHQAPATASDRIKRFRERCLNDDGCIAMVVRNAGAIIETAGVAPEQARRYPGPQLEPEHTRPTPPPPPSPDAPAAEARARIRLTNEYCDLKKLAGTWKGRYSHGAAIVPFDLVLTEKDGALTGESTEPDTRPGRKGTVTARWAGVRTPQGMTFERHYVVAPEVVSRYYGYCNKESNIVSGEWRLGEGLRGEFELLKQ